MNGMNFHSWSGMGIKEKLDEIDLEKLERKEILGKDLKKSRVLKID
jgi:hypothetical protein